MARPLKYKTVDELEAAIEEYFKACEGEPLLDAAGQPVLIRGCPIMLGVKPPTVTGLALALGLSGRQALLNYQGRKGFMDAITRAKARCEEYAEGRLYDRDGTHGAQFSLRCNFGWSDREAEADGPTDNLLQVLSDDAAKLWRSSDTDTEADNKKEDDV